MDYQAIQKDFDTLEKKYSSRLGQKDFLYIKKTRRLSRLFEVIGRSLIWFGKDPFSFILGTLLLAMHRSIETLEIGHNVLHGQYDMFPEIPEFHSHNFSWKAPVDEEGWRRLHNGIHHIETNVAEVDPDLYHGFMRTSETTPWSPWHYFQVPIYFLTLYPRMTYLYNVQTLGFFDQTRLERFKSGNRGYAIFTGDQSKESIQARQKRSRRSINRVLFKEYLLFPFLALMTTYSFLRVAFANLLSEIIANYWITLSLEISHIPKSLQVKNTIENKGRWYVAQIDSTQNYKTNRFFTLLWGHNNYQIEHHLFPNLPSHHLPAIAKEVRLICQKHAIEYTLHPSWFSAFSSFLKKFVKYSFPNRAKQES